MAPIWAIKLPTVGFGTVPSGAAGKYCRQMFMSALLQADWMAWRMLRSTANAVLPLRRICCPEVDLF